MIRETWEEDIRRTRRRLGWLRRLGIALIIVPCLAAAGTVGYRVAQWRGNSEAARCVAVNAHAPDAERVQAIEGMRRDVAMTIAVLRQLASEPGDIGEQARTALSRLQERIR
jgi:hypothetical protein